MVGYPYPSSAQVVHKSSVLYAGQAVCSPFEAIAEGLRQAEVPRKQSSFPPSPQRSEPPWRRQFAVTGRWRGVHQQCASARPTRSVRKARGSAATRQTSASQCHKHEMLLAHAMVKVVGVKLAT